MNEEIVVIQTIHRYVRGELSVTESDGLWMRLLEEPEYFEYLIIEVCCRDFFQRAGTISAGEGEKVKQV